VSTARLARPFALAIAAIATAVLAPGSYASTVSFAGPAVTGAVVTGATVTGPVVTGAVVAGPVVAGAELAEYSPNWGGYVASGTTFRYVKATFTVPPLDCDKTPGKPGNPTMVGVWVGLDSTTVEQDGIQGQCDSNRTAQYSAWYEMYPKPAAYPALSITAGDTIQASVWYVASMHQYELILTDVTKHQGFTEWERCGKSTCANSSAEVITEAPGKPGGGYFLLADSGTISYTGISLTDAAGQHGTFASGYWRTTKFLMQDGAGRVKTAIGDLTGNGAAFTTSWERES
jgi:hypothetical protein